MYIHVYTRIYKNIHIQETVRLRLNRFVLVQNKPLKPETGLGAPKLEPNGFLDLLSLNRFGPIPFGSVRFGLSHPRPISNRLRKLKPKWNRTDKPF